MMNGSQAAQPARKSNKKPKVLQPDRYAEDRYKDLYDRCVQRLKNTHKDAGVVVLASVPDERQSDVNKSWCCPKEDCDKKFPKPNLVFEHLDKHRELHGQTVRLYTTYFSGNEQDMLSEEAIVFKYPKEYKIGSARRPVAKMPVSTKKRSRVNSLASATAAETPEPQHDVLETEVQRRTVAEIAQDAAAAAAVSVTADRLNVTGFADEACAARQEEQNEAAPPATREDQAMAGARPNETSAALKSKTAVQHTDKRELPHAAPVGEKVVDLTGDKEVQQGAGAHRGPLISRGCRSTPRQATPRAEDTSLVEDLRQQLNKQRQELQDALAEVSRLRTASQGAQADVQKQACSGDCRAEFDKLKAELCSIHQTQLKATKDQYQTQQQTQQEKVVELDSKVYDLTVQLSQYS